MIIRRYASLLSCLIMLVLGTACNRGERIPEEIERCNVLIDSLPDEALKDLLRLGDKYADAPEAVRMRLALLRVKAADRVFAKSTSDEEMSGIKDYYEAHGTPDERMTAYYYMGSTYRDLHDSFRAQKWFLKALEAAQETPDPDHYILLRVYVQLSELYSVQGKYAESLAAQKKSYAIEQADGTANFESWSNMGDAYKQCGQRDSAYHYYRKVLLAIRKDTCYEKYLSDIGSQLMFYYDNRDLYGKEYVFCRDILDRYPMTALPVNVRCAKANALAQSGQKDSALVYYLSALDDLRYYNHKSIIARRIYDLYAGLGETEKALEYAGCSFLYADSARKEQQEQEVLFADKEFKSQQEMSAERFRADAASAGLWGWIAGGCVLVLVIAGGWSYRKIYVLKRQSVLREKQLKELTARMAADEAAAGSDISVNELSERPAPYHDDSVSDNSEISHLDFISIFETVSHTKGMIDDSTWELLYDAINRRYPGFRDRVSAFQPSLSLDDMKLVYLRKLGCRQSDIARLLTKAPSTINRKFEKYSALFEP